MAIVEGNPVEIPEVTDTNLVFNGSYQSPNISEYYAPSRALYGVTVTVYVPAAFPDVLPVACIATVLINHRI